MQRKRPLRLMSRSGPMAPLTEEGEEGSCSDVRSKRHPEHLSDLLGTRKVHRDVGPKSAQVVRNDPRVLVSNVEDPEDTSFVGDSEHPSFLVQIVLERHTKLDHGLG